MYAIGTMPAGGAVVATPCGSATTLDGATADATGSDAHGWDAGANCDVDVRACHAATTSSIASAPLRLARKVFTAVLLDWGALPCPCSRKMPAHIPPEFNAYPAGCLPLRSSVSPRGNAARG